MGNMLEQMKKKTIKATSVASPSKVIQKISRADIEKLNRANSSTIEQNHKELRDYWKAMRGTTIFIFILDI